MVKKNLKTSCKGLMSFYWGVLFSNCENITLDLVWLTRILLQ